MKYSLNHLKIVTLIVIVLLTITASINPLKHAKGATVMELDTQKPIGKIDNTYTQTSASGVIIGKHKVLTAYHAVKDRNEDTRIRFTPQKNSSSDADQIYASKIQRVPGADLAVIITHQDLSCFGHMTMSPKPPKPGTHIKVTGYPNMHKSHDTTDYMHTTHYTFKGINDGKVLLYGNMYCGTSGAAIAYNHHLFGIATFQHHGEAVSGGESLTPQKIRYIQRVH